MTHHAAAYDAAQTDPRDPKCPKCGTTLNPAALLGSMTSKAKASASRANGKLGGWPKGKKRGKKISNHAS